MDYSTVPATITLKNVGEEPVGFNYYKVNFTEVLENTDDSVVLTAQTSEEVAYYMSLADEKVGLEVTMATVSSD